MCDAVDSAPEVARDPGGELHRLLAHLASRALEHGADEAPEPGPMRLAVPAPPPPRPARLRHPGRACLETNLARRGLWRLTATSAEVPLTLRDRLGELRVEAGPSGPLTVTELEVCVWLCSRWRELADPKARVVPLALSSVAADLGWGTGGRSLHRVALALDRLRDTAITAETWAPGESVPRSRRRFGLVSDWQAGRPDAPGLLREHGWAVLGDWLAGQLRGGHRTYLRWGELRALTRPAARRLLVFLDAERFDGPERAWPAEAPFLLGLGLSLGNPRAARRRLEAAAEELTSVVPRYRVRLVAGAGGPLLVAERRAR